MTSVRIHFSGEQITVASRVLVGPTFEHVPAVTDFVDDNDKRVHLTQPSTEHSKNK